ncbi:hypothetical protein [Brevibacillus borstelensis]|uniref:hypothetical protein n=1 Tax=Brevibacillus borstelensis TaxID=45462 RepID=UPI00287FEBAD|nr:hypothetical protein [Brevibacillus borstelensis]WNF07440.1 hypothetical protein RFB14_08545 [Brevibacillus borstelensis]
MIGKLRVTPEAQADVVKLIGIEHKHAASWINSRIRRATRVSSNSYRFGDYLFDTKTPGERTKVVRVRRVSSTSADGKDGVEIDGIFIRAHAIDRAYERFGIPRSQAAQWIYERFRESSLVTQNIYSYTNEGHVYATRGIALGVDVDRKTIRTVFYNTKRFPPSISEKVRVIVAKELRKIERKIDEINRSLPLQRAALEYERAERMLALLGTRSVAKKMALQARINAIDIHLNELDEELERLIEAKKHAANAYIAV